MPCLRRGTSFVALFDDWIRRLKKRGKEVERKRVGIVLFEDIEVLDFCGPFEVFSVTRLNEEKRREEPSPFEVWLAIGEKDRKPQISYPPLRIVRFSGEARSFGIEQRKIEGVTLSVYSAAKTVADCFKYRNKIGLDVAIEALKDCRRSRKATIDQLWKAAKVCRMANVMRPYLEATG